MSFEVTTDASPLIEMGLAARVRKYKSRLRDAAYVTRSLCQALPSARASEGGGKLKSAVFATTYLPSLPISDISCTIKTTAYADLQIRDKCRRTGCVYSAPQADPKYDTGFTQFRVDTLNNKFLAVFVCPDPWKTLYHAPHTLFS